MRQQMIPVLSVFLIVHTIILILFYYIKHIYKYIIVFVQVGNR